MHALQSQLHLLRTSAEQPFPSGQECQNRKIKCGIEADDAACPRCRRLGLQCVVNKSLQTLLENETEWRTAMEQKTNALQAAVSEILRTMNLPPLSPVSRSASAISAPDVD